MALSLGISLVLGISVLGIIVSVVLLVSTYSYHKKQKVSVYSIDYMLFVSICVSVLR